MCVQYRGSYLEYRGEYHDARGGYHDARGGYHENHGGVQYRGGKIFTIVTPMNPSGTVWNVVHVWDPPLGIMWGFVWEPF